MSSIIITNNKYVYEKYKDTMDVDYKEDYTYLQVLSF